MSAVRLAAAVPLLFCLFTACGRDAAAPAAGAAPAARWLADAHTHDAVAKLRAAYAQHPVRAPAVAEYHALGDAMYAEIQALMAGCRMTGPEHDALHDWLLGLLRNVEMLRDGEDAAALATAQQGASAALDRFDERFRR